jgi:hypothetical protein
MRPDASGKTNVSEYGSRTRLQLAGRHILPRHSSTLHTHEIWSQAQTDVEICSIPETIDNLE